MLKMKLLTSLLLIAFTFATLPTTTEARHRDRDSYREYSRTSENIDDLDNDIVEEIFIPILFGVKLSDIADNYGDPRDGGARTHEGIDMFAPIGTPIISPTEAVITHIGDGSSAGNYVFTANPGGESFRYMHLDEISDDISRGDTIKKGTYLGTVGNTGNASGGAAHLHFEIREDGDAINPYSRIALELDPEDKGKYLDDIFDDLSRSEREDLADFLTENFKSEIDAIENGDADLPDEVEENVEEERVQQTAEDLIGTSGDVVQIIQEFLILLRRGPASDALRSAGATGYFGSVTYAALIEYQGGTTTAYETPLESTTDNVEVTNSNIPQVDLEIEATGSNVVWLQEFLIRKSIGVEAIALAEYGATGYFGPATERALIEYQSAVGISPASGYFGQITRNYIAENE